MPIYVRAGATRNTLRGAKRISQSREKYEVVRVIRKTEGERRRPSLEESGRGVWGRPAVVAGGAGNRLWQGGNQPSR